MTHSPGVSGYLLPPRTRKQGSSEVVSKPRETEGEEKDEGSLSIFIVPMKDGESAPRDPSQREGRCLFVDM